MDGLGNAGIGVGVIGIEFRCKTLGVSGLCQEGLGLLGVIGVTLVILVIAGHRGRQGLIGGNGPVVHDLADPFFVDGHVDGLTHLDIVKGRDFDIHGDITGVGLSPLDDHAFELGVLLDLQKTGRRDAVSQDIHLSPLEPQNRHRGFLADLEDDLIQPG